MKALKFLTILILPITVYISFTNMGWLTLLPLVVFFGFVPLLELLFNPDKQNLNKEQEGQEKEEEGQGLGWRYFTTKAQVSQEALEIRRWPSSYSSSTQRRPVRGRGSDVWRARAITDVNPYTHCH